MIKGIIYFDLRNFGEMDQWQQRANNDSIKGLFFLAVGVKCLKQEIETLSQGFTVEILQIDFIL